MDSDPTYCVPDRTNFDNIFLVRDLIDMCKSEANINAGIASLGEEKALDRVDYSYLFSALMAFWFGDVFLPRLACCTMVHNVW